MALLGPLEAWVAALDRYARALSKYIAVVDEVARKVRPVARAGYRQALDAATRSLSSVGAGPQPAGGGASLAEAAFDLFAQLESVKGRLDAAAYDVLDPTLLEEATRGMSRTYIEGVGLQARALREARTAAAVAVHLAATALSKEWAPKVVTGEPRVIARAYEEGPKTAAGAALFAEALVEWERAGVAVQAFAEGAKDAALGLPPDAPGAVQEAAGLRARMHPLQAMGLTFSLVAGGGAEAEGGAAVAVDATLPQARTSVRYHLAPLVDAQAAAAYGPLASSDSGLNYRLVERLRTITEEPIPPTRAERPPPSIRVAAGAAASSTPGGVIRTIDGGSTWQPLRGPLPADAYSSLGAGPRPRVAQVGVLLEEAVFGGDASARPPRTIADPRRLLEEHAAQACELSARISLDALGQTLLKRFGAVYDAAPPATVEGFKAMVLGECLSRDPFRSYIAQAVSEVSRRGAGALLLRVDAAGARGLARLCGSGGAATTAGRQEALLTSLVQLRQSVTAARRQIMQAYDSLETDARMRGAFSVDAAGSEGVGSGAVLSAATRSARMRLEALGAYRAVVEEAFHPPRPDPRGGRSPAQVVEKQGAVEPRPSLKLYVLVRGDASAETDAA